MNLVKLKTIFWCIGLATGATVKKLTIDKIVNLGETQDSWECYDYGGKGNYDEITFGYKSNNENQDWHWVIYNQPIGRGEINQPQKDNKFLCVDTAQFYLREEDTVGLLNDDEVHKTVRCDTGQHITEMIFQLTNRCAEGLRNYVYYQIEYTVSEFTGSMVELKYLYNINAPSEWTQDKVRTSVFSGDEINVVASYDDYKVNLNIPYVTFTTYIKMERNSILAFDNIVLPCDGLRIHLFEKDWSVSTSEVSNVLRCNSN